MATSTLNYKLIKPDPEDYYDVMDINGNMDVLDDQVGALSSNLAKKADKLSGATDGHLAVVTADGGYREFGISAEQLIPPEVQLLEWHDPVFQNNFAQNWWEPAYALRYAKSLHGDVYIFGICVPPETLGETTDERIIFTLPEKFRPRHGIISSVLSQHLHPVAISVDSSGNVRLNYYDISVPLDTYGYIPVVFNFKAEG